MIPHKIKYMAIFSIVMLSMNMAQGEFAPWNTDVNTGDSLYHVHKPDNRSHFKILNGAQGGAFFLIRFYQVVLSPQDGPNCRHIPTCSAYGRQAVVKHGAFLGSIMAGERLLRCNPYYPPERDPVPEKVFVK